MASFFQGFMMSKKHYRFSHEDAVSAGRISGARAKKLKLGIFAITPGSPEHLENCRKGGLGSVQGALNVASGQWEKVRNSEAAVKGRLEWARSEENKTRCSEMGRLQGVNVDWEKVRTKESCSKGQEAGGDKSRHVRWHVNRRIFNLACPFCLEAIARQENWGIPIEDPE